VRRTCGTACVTARGLDDMTTARPQNLRVLEGSFVLTRVTDVRAVAFEPDLLALVLGPDGGATMRRDDTAEDAWAALWNGDDAHDPRPPGDGVSGTARPSLDGELSIGSRVTAVEVTRQPPRALQPSYKEVYLNALVGGRGQTCTCSATGEPSGWCSTT
jgi:hypothetical protein